MATSKDTHVDDLYAAYASGTLDPGFGLMLEAQSRIRADVSARMAFASNVSGAFLEDEAPTEMSDGALEATLSEIDTLEADIRAAEAKAARSAGHLLEEMLSLPENLHPAMFDAVESDGWSPLLKGVERLPLSVGSEAEVELYRLTPGTKVPMHRHEGVELTLVLKGKYSDATGEYGAGDVSIKGPDDKHSPTVHEDDGICYTLAVRDGGLRFTGPLGMIQRVMELR